MSERNIKRAEIEDAFVRNHAVPETEAESFVHLGMDDAYHSTGGYWFPTGQEWGDEWGHTGWVPSYHHVPLGELIQYPCDDRPPEIRGRDDLPDWVVWRYIPDDAQD